MEEQLGEGVSQHFPPSYGQALGARGALLTPWLFLLLPLGAGCAVRGAEPPPRRGAPAPRWVLTPAWGEGPSQKKGGPGRLGLARRALRREASGFDCAE